MRKFYENDEYLDDEEDDDEFDCIEDELEYYMGYNLRYKYCDVNPHKDTLTYVTQEPIDAGDFETFLDTLANSTIADDLEGKTYAVDMHCRSGKQYGWFKANVTFSNGSYSIQLEEEEFYNADLEIYACRDGNRYYFRINDGGVDGEGDTIEEAAKDLIEWEWDGVDYYYTDLEPGCKVSNFTVNLEDFEECTAIPTKQKCARELYEDAPEEDRSPEDEQDEVLIDEENLLITAYDAPIVR